MELLLENFAHYSEHLGGMSSAGFAYYGQAWEKMLGCYDFEAAVCHELTTFGAGCNLLPGFLFLVSLVWFLHLIRRKKQSSRLPSEKAGDFDEFKKIHIFPISGISGHSIPANREQYSRFAGIYIDKTHTRH